MESNNKGEIDPRCLSFADTEPGIVRISLYVRGVGPKPLPEFNAKSRDKSSPPIVPNVATKSGVPGY
jgi:hypothetical protein